MAKEKIKLEDDEVVAIEEEHDNAVEEDVELKKELTGIFSAESVRYLEVLKNTLDQASESNENIRLHEDFSHALHNLLGSARTASVEPVVALCEPLEIITYFILDQDVSCLDEQLLVLEHGITALIASLEQLTIHGEAISADDELLSQLHDLNKQLHSAKEQESEPNSEQLVENSGSTPSIDEQIDIFADIDEELCEIFVEEAEDVLADCQASLQKLKDNLGNADAFSEMRRQLHTLKGSSRMAGFSTIGELSHATETLVVALHDERIACNDEIISLLQQVVDAIHVNVESAQAKTDVSLDTALYGQVLLASGENIQSVDEVENDLESVVAKTTAEEIVIDASALDLQEASKVLAVEDHVKPEFDESVC